MRRSNRRIVGFADCDETRAEPNGVLHLGLRFGDAGDAYGAQRAAPLRQIRQGGERRLGRAEPVYEIAKGRRSDILGTDQAQPAQALPVVEQPAGSAGLAVHPLASPLAPIRDSVPERSREMLVRCLMKTITLISAASSAVSRYPVR